MSWRPVDSQTLTHTEPMMHRMDAELAAAKASSGTEVPCVMSRPILALYKM